MGTASTMQIMAEALGLMLPGTALMPATAPELKQAAYDAGKQLMKLVEKGIKAKDIVTMKSFENAIMVHACLLYTSPCLRKACPAMFKIKDL